MWKSCLEKFGNLEFFFFYDNIKVINLRKYDIYLENVVVRKDCIWINKMGCFVFLKLKIG